MTESDDEKLFTDNAFYLLAHHRRILSDGRMAQCSLPCYLVMPFINTTGKKNRPTLGSYLEWWTDYSFTKLYSRDEEKSTDGNSPDSSMTMMKTLIFSLTGSPLSGSNSCRGVQEDGSVISIVLSPFSKYVSTLLNLASTHRMTGLLLQGEPFSLQQVIETLRREDSDRFRNGEEARKEFSRVIDEVFAGTDQWLSCCSYYRNYRFGGCVVRTKELQNIKNAVADMLKSAPEHLRNSEEFIGKTVRLSVKKKFGAGLTDVLAAEADNCLSFWVSAYLKLVSELRAGLITAVYLDYLDALEKNKDELEKISADIKTARAGLKNGTVTQKDGSKRIYELKKRRRSLEMETKNFLEYGLTVIVGKSCYRMLRFNEMAVLERFVAEHGSSVPAGLT